jgi:flavin reductase (DIM6/NTAB) family NADH-FMN oxidoreductase RutF
MVDVRSFWGAVGQRALVSTIVTAWGAGGPAVFLGLSATHVCADPPTMLVSIDKRTSALSTILESRHFAINYLARAALPLADMFGGKGTQKGTARFEGVPWRRLVTGAPVFDEAIGAIDCTLEETIERHGICIAIGRVVEVFEGSGVEPLIHFRGGYWP